MKKANDKTKYPYNVSHPSASDANDNFDQNSKQNFLSLILNPFWGDDK